MEIDFDRVLDALPAMVWTALPDGHIDFVNRRWCEYTGLALERPMAGNGRRWSTRKTCPNCSNAGDRFWHPASPAKWRRAYDAPTGSIVGSSSSAIRCATMPGGSSNGAGGTDVDDFRRAERDLRLTIDTIPAFVAAYQPDGSRSFVNRTWQDYMGLTLAEVTGPGATTFPHFHPADVERT